MNEVEEKMFAFFVERLEIDADLVKPEADLKLDMGLTSMDAVETRIFVQQNFGWQISKEDIFKLSTFAQLCSAIEEHK